MDCSTSKSIQFRRYQQVSVLICTLKFGFPNVPFDFRFEKMKPQWGSIPDLATQEIKLRQKISLLCLMEVSKIEKTMASKLFDNSTFFLDDF